MSSPVAAGSTSSLECHGNPSYIKKRLYIVAGRDVELTVIIFVVLSLLVITARQLAYGDSKLMLWRASTASSRSCDLSWQSPFTMDKLKLKNMLEEAVMEDKKTVILTAINAAWTEPNSTFDLFLESFRVGNQTQHLLKHVLFLTYDQLAYYRCMALDLHCFPLHTDHDFGGERLFMDPEYLNMNWGRIDVLRIVLELGYDFVFTDVDILWLRNPLHQFFPDGDFQMACDSFKFSSTDKRNAHNCGFFYVRSSIRTIKFFKMWFGYRDYYNGEHEQSALNDLKFNPVVDEMNMTMRFFDTKHISNLCDPNTDLDLVVTLHGSCRFGLPSKLRALNAVLKDWRRYITSSERSKSWSFARFP